MAPYRDTPNTRAGIKRANSRRRRMKRAMRKGGPSEDSPFFAPWSQGNRKMKRIPIKMPYKRG